MSIAKKSMVTLAAALITTRFLAPSFTWALDLNPDIKGESQGNPHPIEIERFAFLGTLISLIP